MKTTKTETYEIVSGTRIHPGAVLATFTGSYRSGGPATECLRAYDRMTRRDPSLVAFFRRAA